MQLQEIGLGALRTSERTQAIAERVAGWLATSLSVHPEDGGLPTAQRVRAEDALAMLGDPRFDAGRLHLPSGDALGFVRIAADPGFRIGTRRGDRKRVGKITGIKVSGDEVNDALTPTHEFYIGRYLVTVAQFRDFVEATKSQLGNGLAARGATIHVRRTIRDLRSRMRQDGSHVAAHGNTPRTSRAVLTAIGFALTAAWTASGSVLYVFFLHHELWPLPGVPADVLTPRALPDKFWDVVPCERGRMSRGRLHQSNAGGTACLNAPRAAWTSGTTLRTTSQNCGPWSMYLRCASSCATT